MFTHARTCSETLGSLVFQARSPPSPKSNVNRARRMPGNAPMSRLASSAHLSSTAWRRDGLACVLGPRPAPDGHEHEEREPAGVEHPLQVAGDRAELLLVKTDRFRHPPLMPPHPNPGLGFW